LPLGIPFPRVEEIFEVLPQLAMDRQIDLDRDPFSSLIGDILNSSHISIMPQRGRWSLGRARLFRAGRLEWG
jgi:hypothetical protein